MTRILLVEDEAVLRVTFERFLRAEGYEVRAVESYAAAVAALGDGPPDAVVCDILLPDGSGIDVLRLLRQAHPATDVIMLTGQPEVASAAEAVRLGAFDYLPKPVTGDALKRVVRLALEQRRIAHERDRYASEMERYRQTLESIFHGVSEGIVAVDRNCRIEQINAAAIAMLGAQEDLHGAEAAAIVPKGLKAAIDSLKSAIEGRETTAAERRAEIVLSGGGRKVIVWSTRPLPVGGAMLILRDITRLTSLEEAASERKHSQTIIAKSPRMLEIFQLVRDLAETDSTALICGESGTGKELIAAALHAAGIRRDKPFVRVNCAALSEGLLESELFGHVKGAFTGAVRDRVGRFEAAHGGTILLDEIGDISPRLQLRLLRVLQEREFERVGDSAPLRADVRIIASTHHDLRRRIAEGHFREDLYYRLNVVRIDIPPLRERKADIPLLVQHFIRGFNLELNREVADVTPDVMDALMRYDWPGNVRELENCIERAMIVCREPEIRIDHLPNDYLRSPAPHQPARGETRSRERTDIAAEDVRSALERTDWNIAKAARILGVARNTLYLRIRTLGLERPAEPSPGE